MRQVKAIFVSLGDGADSSGVEVDASVGVGETIAGAGEEAISLFINRIRQTYEKPTF